MSKESAKRVWHVMVDCQLAATADRQTDRQTDRLTAVDATPRKSAIVYEMRHASFIPQYHTCNLEHLQEM